jgi:hypothetical protein
MSHLTIPNPPNDMVILVSSIKGDYTFKEDVLGKEKIRPNLIHKLNPIFIQ